MRDVLFSFFFFLFLSFQSILLLQLTIYFTIFKLYNYKQTAIITLEGQQKKHNTIVLPLYYYNMLSSIYIIISILSIYIHIIICYHSIGIIGNLLL